MVIVQRRPFLIGHADVPFIIVIVINHGNVRAERLLQFAGQGGLAGASAPRDADDHGVHRNNPFFDNVGLTVFLLFVLYHTERKVGNRFTGRLGENQEKRELFRAGT